MCASNDLAERTVGRYRIVSLIGSGGMGEVYDAIDTSLGRHVALKILRADAVADVRRLSRFIQEARTTSVLNHPHLVSIYEIGEAEGVHFIAMEKVDGGTLRSVLANERLSLDRALELMVQITDAVSVAHAAGIVHRDLKPENVMVSSGGYVKVLDFGLAKLQPATLISGDSDLATAIQSTESGTVLGTAGYMAPEQAQGKATDARSDIFALGCILFEMIEGRRAFHALNPIDTLHKIIHEDLPPLRAAASPEVERIVRKATAKDPDLRYQSARDLSIDLRNARNELQSPTRARRHPFALAAIAIAVMVVVTAAFVLLRQPVRKASLQMQRITTTGDVINAVISPDGKYLAYARFEDTGQSAWVRQLSTNQDVLILPNGGDRSLALWGLAFTHDSSRVFVTLRRARNPEGLLSSVAIVGGQIQQVLAGIDSSVSLSPDDRQLTYVRKDFPQPGSSALMIASSDGSGAHAIAVRHAPELFSPIWFTRPSWSPDGKTIAAAVLELSKPPRARIAGIDPKTGAERVIADAGWQHVGAVTWLPDGQSLVAVAGTTSFVDGLQGDRDSPLWLVPVHGTPHLITRDADAYRMPSVSANGSVMTSIRLTQPIIELWRVPLNADPPEKLLTGLRPLPHPALLPSGSVVFASNGVISAVHEKGADNTPRVVELVHDRFQNGRPISFDGGIVYGSATPQGEVVCITSTAGEGRTVITSGQPAGVSRDGSRILLIRDGALWLRSTADGRDKRVFAPFTTETESAALSPRGDRMAIVHGPSARRKLIVLATDSLQTVKATALTGDWQSMRWTPDGTALLVSGITPDRGNIWKIDFKGEPARVTNFYGQLILDFDVSPDGKTLAVVRSQFERDAVLFRGFQ